MSGGLHQLPAQQIPLSLTAVFDKSVYIEYLSICNTNGVDVTVSVQDGLGNSYMSAATVSANTSGPKEISLPEGGLWFCGGMKWLASTTGVYGWFRARNA